MDHANFDAYMERGLVSATDPYNIALGYLAGKSLGLPTISLVTRSRLKTSPHRRYQNSTR